MPETTISFKRNRVKNPYLTEGKPAGYLKRSPRIWTLDYPEQIQRAVRVGFKLDVQRSNHSATLPHYRPDFLSLTGMEASLYTFKTAYNMATKITHNILIISNI